MRFTSSAFAAAICFGALTTGQALQTSFQLTGKTLVLGNISYFIPPTPVSQLKLERDANTLSLLSKIAASFAGEIIPITVIPTSETVFGQAQFESTFSSYKAKDDVFSESFLTGERLFSCRVTSAHQFAQAFISSSPARANLLRRSRSHRRCSKLLLF